MRLVLSWLRDFVDVSVVPAELASTLDMRGFEVASIDDLGGGDAVIDFEVTANRPDCLSVVGFAREVATVYDAPRRAGARRARRGGPRPPTTSRCVRRRSPRSTPASRIGCASRSRTPTCVP